MTANRELIAESPVSYKHPSLDMIRCYQDVNGCFLF